MMKEDEILCEGITALEDRLQKVPFLEIIRGDLGDVDLNGFRLDGLLRVRTPQGEQLLVIEAKSKGQPLYARNAVNALLVASIARANVLGIFVAPYISTESARICREAGVGYLDLSGNCWLSFQQVYIQAESYPSKFSKRRDLVSLYSAKTERILRVLLSDPNHFWKTVELQKMANVAIGLVSHVKSRLSENEWIRTNPQGFALSEPKALLSEWSKAYDFRRNQAYEYYTIKSPVEFERSLAEISQQEKCIYALTGFSAANRLAPNVRNQRSMAYIDGEIPAIAEQLGLKRVNSGANVSLLKPYDEGVFWGTTEINGIRIVTPIQAYLDLQHNRGRGEEAANFLFNEVIEKQWSTSTITAQTK